MKNVIVAQNTPTAFAEKLLSFGFNVLYGTENKNVQKGVAYHIDMQIVFINKSVCMCAPECFEYYKKLLDFLNITVISGNISLNASYPNDCAYNIAVFGNFAVGNFKFCDTALKKMLENSGKTLISVNQGYAKCSICPISENAVITADNGIYKTLLPYGIDVLKISEGGIYINGYNYGFIGGAAGYVGNDVYFCGDIKSHPDYESICTFLHKHGKNIVCSDNILTDVGTILFLA